MRATRVAYDVIIIGGGFYGACLALALKKYYKSVVIVEKEAEMLSQASYVNQATIHNGYHYPRSYLTALRSKTNFPIFAQDFPESVFDDYERIYAVAARNSKVSARQFSTFCKRLAVPIKVASQETRALFDPDMIEEVFTVKEYAFNAKVLRDSLKDRLHKSKVEILLSMAADTVKEENGQLVVHLISGDKIIAKSQVICCVYGSTNFLLSRSGLPTLPLKHEMTEVALVDVPETLKKLGITVIDGLFFATMPFPMTAHHSLTHVRYTPQKTFADGENHDGYKPRSNFQFMIRDAVRYLPALRQATYKSSLFTIKTVLPQHERDDGRPILYRKDYCLKNFSVIVGGKIDNIYDIYEAMDL